MTTNLITEFAPAKVNLSLHVTGQREDGYHVLDSLVAFADFGDAITVQPARDMRLSVSGPLGKNVPTDARNLMWRAAESVGQTLDMALVKNLPSEAGIGGGSADAAAVLRAAERLGVRIAPDAVLALGADVPVCMASTATRMRGIGEQLEKITLPPLPALIVNPLVSVPTGAVFSAMDQKTNAPMPETLPTFDGVSDCVDWLMLQRNDLEHPAMSQAPVIERVLGDLSNSRDARMARMSGSGATCFAIYPTLKAAQFAAYEVGAEHTDWWVRATVLT